MALGRARRGVSGALYPKSAIAGLNSRPRPDVLWDCLCRVVLKIGPCAAESYEPRQVRKEAAVSSRFWVPQDLLVGAVRQRKAIGQGRRQVHDPDSISGRLSCRSLRTCRRPRPRACWRSLDCAPRRGWASTSWSIGECSGASCPRAISLPKIR